MQAAPVHDKKMILARTLHGEGSNGPAALETPLDSGATYSCIRPDLAEKREAVRPLPRALGFETASEGAFVRVENRVTVDFHLNDLRLTDELRVVPKVSGDAILGATTMQKRTIRLEFEQEAILTDSGAARMNLKHIASASRFPKTAPILMHP
jgi:hypothetical protein